MWAYVQDPVLKPRRRLVFPEWFTCVSSGSWWIGTIGFFLWCSSQWVSGHPGPAVNNEVLWGSFSWCTVEMMWGSAGAGSEVSPHEQRYRRPQYLKLSLHMWRCPTYTRRKIPDPRRLSEQCRKYPGSFFRANVKKYNSFALRHKPQLIMLLVFPSIRPEWTIYLAFLMQSSSINNSDDNNNNNNNNNLYF